MGPQPGHLLSRAMGLTWMLEQGFQQENLPAVALLAEAAWLCVSSCPLRAVLAQFLAAAPQSGLDFTYFLAVTDVTPRDV